VKYSEKTPQPPEDRNGRPLAGRPLEVWQKRQAWLKQAAEAEEDIRATARVLAKVAARLTDKTDDQADALALLAGREDAARLLRAAGLDRPDVMERLRLDIADAELRPAAGDQEPVPAFLQHRLAAQALGRRGIPEGPDEDEDRGFLRRRRRPWPVSRAWPWATGCPAWTPSPASSSAAATRPHPPTRTW
jgi:hypothetical protein